jgi:ABC-type antimicrobial peptide transport system permease subunit
LLVRTVGNPAPLLPVLGSALQRVDANLPVSAATLNTMVYMDPYFAVSRIGGFLASIVGALGLLLACMGVYGMFAYTVEQRTRELLCAVATVACCLPARKAIRVDPVVALRHE